jgi:hypothetical protein
MQTRPLVYHPGGPPGEMPPAPEEKKRGIAAHVGISAVIALVLIALAVLVLSKCTPMIDSFPYLYNGDPHRSLK